MPRNVTSKPAPVTLSVTFDEAARLAGVSRPYLVKQVELGRIPLHQKVGNQRRLSKRDVLAWQARGKRGKAEAFRRLASELDDEIFRG